MINVKFKALIEEGSCHSLSFIITKFSGLDVQL